VEIADLASMTQVRALAGRLAALERAGVLISNAGLVLGERRVTLDGFEHVFAVNHLAPFLPTNLLLPKLGAAAPARRRGVSRLVAVSFVDLVTRGQCAVDRGWPGGRLFPALDANITLTPDGVRATLPRLAEAYRPPLGTLGTRLDAAITHRVAAATMRSFARRGRRRPSSIRRPRPSPDCPMKGRNCTGRRPSRRHPRKGLTDPGRADSAAGGWAGRRIQPPSGIPGPGWPRNLPRGLGGADSSPAEPHADRRSLATAGQVNGL